MDAERQVFSLEMRILTAIGLIGLIALHVFLVYVWQTGEMIGRGAVWVEGRKSAPILFWTYFAFLAVPTGVLDFFCARAVIRWVRVVCAQKPGNPPE